MTNIVSVGDEHACSNYFSNWREITHFSSLRAIKKQFRNISPGLLIIYATNDDNLVLGESIIQYIREGLLNRDIRIVLMREPNYSFDEIDFLERLDINGCLSADLQSKNQNLLILNRELDTFYLIENSRKQHDAETKMLMCITRFSKSDEPIEELLKTFSEPLANLCRSPYYVHIKTDVVDQSNIIFHNSDESELIDATSYYFNLPQLSSQLKSVFDEKQPQVDLVADNDQLSVIEDKIGLKIGSYLIFPIVVYDRAIYLLVYFIPEMEMDKVSIKQVDIIKKASEQLTLLMERRKAELSLKKQYQRLRSTIIELKSTKEELNQKEKMASVGQMAAGIAHEINNPLSFVISNYSSMDRYLQSIMELQKLQAEFLNSIDLSQDDTLAKLKQNISDFEEEEDIPFILEDIKAVVSDSYVGLKRVKNIIVDLKSLTQVQTVEYEVCDVKKIIEDTVKILRYEILENIEVDIYLHHEGDLIAHSGLVQQVFTNLIKNAAQAMRDADTSSPHIEIYSKTTNQELLFGVKDNGPGIPEDVKKKIFEPFYTTKSVGGGTGLGLSVSFNIMKRFDGNITINSEPDKFTEFLLHFPMKSA